ncbi:MAG TPA: hypothetical protein VEL68_19140 [Thermodesulfobacteriota bacterium]|nr:hypothetical protein [Thermodesulfobacteriota bacterium]
MDVKEIGGPPLAFGKKGKREEMEGADFQKALQEAHSHLKESPSPSTSTGGAGGAEWLEPVTFQLLPSNLAVGAPSPQSQGTEVTERTLNLLERYQAALSDPRVSLKEVYPLVQSLRQEVQELDRWSDQLPPSDPLRKMMGEIGILSNVEIEKFNRGDYV